jgi:hypothetical protein
VHNRLYNSMRTEQPHFSSTSNYYKSQMEQPSSITHSQQFIPQINKKSQQLKRPDKVQNILFNDAQRRH